ERELLELELLQLERVLSRFRSEEHVAAALAEIEIAKLEIANVLATGHGEGVSSPEEKIKELFAGLPADPQERLETLARLFSAIRQKSAEGMQAAIVALLKGAQQLDYDGKVELCRRINRALDDSHLAILDPETDLPARLKPMRSGGGPSTEVS